MALKKIKPENSIIDPEYGVDFRYTNEKEGASEAITFMEARLKRMKNLSQEQTVRARLVQLKLNMEDYLKHPVFDNRNSFAEFLKFYINAIYPKHSSFAKDIDITSVGLSQVINKHREPQDEFMMKLMIHSEKVYSTVCTFPQTIWYQVYFHEKLCDTMSSQDKWRPKIEKSVRFRETI